MSRSTTPATASPPAALAGGAGIRPRLAVSSARRAARWLLVMSFALPMLLFLGAAWYDQQTLARETEARLAGSAEALAEQTDQSLATVDVTLSRVLDRLSGMEWPTIAASPGVHDFLARLQAQQPQIGAIFLVDPSGVEAASSTRFPTPAIDRSTRPYFTAAMNGVTGLMLTPPIQAGSTGAFILSRARISEGAFDGVVGIVVSRPVLAGLMRAAALPRHATAALLGPDGHTLLAASKAVPAALPTGELASLPALGAPAGLRQLAGAEEAARNAALIRLPRFAMTVLVAGPRFAWLGEWLTHMAILAVFALLAGAALWLTSWIVLAQAQRTEAQLALLLAETERRQEAEQSLLQIQKMEALGRLSGGVAHDFNNLLAAILGSVELGMRRVQEPERVLRLLSGIRQAAERGATLTAQMLTFARGHTISRRSIDINELLRGIEDLLRRTAGSLVRVTYDLGNGEEGNGLARAEADPLQLERALLHLVMNARDAMPLGGELVVQTEAVAGLSPGEPGRLCISVRDTGEGMSEQVRASAFEPFFTTRGPGKGTGLGLSMVHGFAEQMGGSAQIESRFGEGTTVRLFLPVAPAEEAAPISEPAASAGAVVLGGRRLDVLLVDDDAAVRAMTREMLSELGHRTLDCAGGREALDLLRAGRGFDVLLIDFAMTGPSGQRPTGSEIAEAAQALSPGLGVLFLTGYVDAEALAGWAGRGAHSLAKPFQLAELAEALAATAGRGGRVVPLRRAT